VVVVDEAILSLTSYRLADPLSIFYSDRPADLSSLYSRASIVLADPQALLGAAMGGAVERSVVKESLAMEMEAPMAPAPAMGDFAEGWTQLPAQLHPSGYAPISTRWLCLPLSSVRMPGERLMWK
jgi:hypothetical protein